MQRPCTHACVWARAGVEAARGGAWRTWEDAAQHMHMGMPSDAYAWRTWEDAAQHMHMGMPSDAYAWRTWEDAAQLLGVSSALAEGDVDLVGLLDELPSHPEGLHMHTCACI